MKHQVSDAILKRILEKANTFDTYAKMSACSYAQTDEKSHQASYEKYSNIAEVLRTLHSEVAQGLHMIEADRPKDFKN